MLRLRTQLALRLSGRQAALHQVQWENIRILIQRKHCPSSGIGPFAYVINASDLRVLHDLDELNKYANDSYLIVSSVNSHLAAEELAEASEGRKKWGVKIFDIRTCFDTEKLWS